MAAVNSPHRRIKRALLLTIAAALFLILLGQGVLVSADTPTPTPTGTNTPTPDYGPCTVRVDTSLNTVFQDYISAGNYREFNMPFGVAIKIPSIMLSDPNVQGQQQYEIALTFSLGCSLQNSHPNAINTYGVWRDTGDPGPSLYTCSGSCGQAIPIGSPGIILRDRGYMSLSDIERRPFSLWFIINAPGMPTSTPTFTPTTTGTPPTPTPTRTPNPDTTQPGRSCVLLGINNALIYGATSWTYSAGARQNPAGGIELPHLGQANLRLRMNQPSQYRIEVEFVNQGSIPFDISISLGREPLSIFSFGVAAGRAETRPSNYTPLSDGYYHLKLKVSRPGGNSSNPTGTPSGPAPAVPQAVEEPPPEPTASATPGAATNRLVIKWVCVIETTAGGVISAPDPNETARQQETCRECRYAPDGGLENIISDIGKAFEWLGCVLAQLLECLIFAALRGAWEAIMNIGGLMVLFFAWFVDSGARVLEWSWNAIKAVSFFLVGFLTNILIFLGSIFDIARMIERDLQRGLEALKALVGLLKTFGGFWEAFNGAYNAEPTAFSSAGSFFRYIGLGFFVLDNTIFTGIVRWIVVLPVQALIIWRMGLWLRAKLTRLLLRT